MPIFSLAGAAVAGTMFAAGTSAFAITSSLVAGGLAFGTSLLFQQLTRQKSRSYGGVQGQIQYGANISVSALFGPGKTKGHHVFYAKYGSGNKFNADVYLLANGRCDGLEQFVFFGGKKQTLVTRTIIGNEAAHYGVSGFGDLISIRFYDGRPGQGVDTKLVADTAALGQTWKSTSVCAGMAYVVLERTWDEDKVKTREEFEFVLRGLREYDPRFDSTVSGGSGAQRLNNPATWVYTENPAVHRLNYQLGLRGLISGRTLIGEGKSLGQLDLGSYFAAMNACDALRAGKPTYRCGMFVTADDDHTEVLKEFDDAMAGYALNRRGLSGVVAGAPQIPVATITADDIPMGRPQDLQRRKSAFEMFNHLSGQFLSKEANWNADSLIPVYVNADVAADGRTRQATNDFLQVTDPDIAQYLLNIRYRQNRKGGSATVPVSRRLGFKVQEGEWVTFDGKSWLVTGWRCDEQLRVTLVLAETGADVYSEAGIVPGPVIIPPTAPVNPSLLSTVQNFNVEAGFVTDNAGRQTPVLRFTWTPPADPTITQVRFFYGIGTSSVGLTIVEDATSNVEAGEYVTSKNVIGEVQYTARATITPVPDRLKTYTPWRTTATSTVRFQWPVSEDMLSAQLLADQAWIRGGIRDVQASVDAIVKRTVDQDFANFADKQQLRTELTTRAQGIESSYTLLVNTAVGVVDGKLTGVTQRVETLELGIQDRASIAAVNAIDLRLTTAEGSISTQGTAISGLSSALAGKADVSVTDALDIKITENASGLQTQAGWLRDARSTVYVNAMGQVEQDFANFRDKTDLLKVSANVYQFADTQVKALNGSLSLQASLIQAVQTAIGTKAEANALIALDSRVGSTPAGYSTFADALLGVSSTVDGVTGGSRVRFSSSHTPALGWDVRAGIEVRVGTTDTFKAAGIYMEATPSASRILFDASQMIFIDSSAPGQLKSPFSIVDGKVNLTGDVRVNGVLLVATSVATGAIANNAVSRGVLANTLGQITGSATTGVETELQSQSFDPGPDVPSTAILKVRCNVIMFTNDTESKRHVRVRLYKNATVLRNFLIFLNYGTQFTAMVDYQEGTVASGSVTWKLTAERVNSDGDSIPGGNGITYQCRTIDISLGAK